MAEWTIRQTSAADRTAVDSLLSSAPRTHLHLDWLDPAELTDRAPFLLALAAEDPVACLAAPPDIPSVAWLRAFAARNEDQIGRAWEQLWPSAARALAADGVSQVAAMALDAWLVRLLLLADFSEVNAVIFLELLLEDAEDLASIGGATRTRRSVGVEGGVGSRPIVSADLPQLLALDAAAFAPMWRLSEDSMRAALLQASSATLIEIDGAAIGYQITTSSPFSVHLARLAVDPRWQRRGLGRSLVEDSIRSAAAQPLRRLSVNTQADNAASLALYQRLGFEQTGQRFPVYTIDLGG